MSDEDIEISLLLNQHTVICVCREIRRKSSVIIVLAVCTNGAFEKLRKMQLKFHQL